MFDSYRVTHRPRRYGIALAACTIAFAVGYASQITAQGLPPDADVLETPTEQKDPPHSWQRPGTGGMSCNSVGAAAWVDGTSLLQNPGDEKYNHWVKSWGNNHYEGEIVRVDEGMWHLDVAANYTLKAEAIYAPTGQVFVEKHRAETTVTIEVRGDFSGFEEVQCIVDSYSTPGVTGYDDAVGGATPPAVYPGRGFRKIVASTAPAAGGASSTWTCDEGVSQWHTGLTCEFDMYSRGKQYIHNSKEEDCASLLTTIEDTDPAKAGWFGTLKAYKVNPDGSTTLIKAFPMP